MAARQRLARGICSLLAQQSSSAACSGQQAAGGLLSAALSHHHDQIAAAAPLLRAAAAAFSRAGLSTTASLHNSSGLSSLLREELDYEKKNYVRSEQVSGGPPAPFKLIEAPGDTLLTLTRTHKNEEISVDLHVNNQPSPPYDVEEGDEEGITTVAFNVSVAKDGKVLLFECESDGSSVNINHVSLEPKDGLASESMYSGPVFDELDDSLQRNFSGFLEERGVTAELGEYLRFLIYDKEQREYQTWLTEVEKFVSK